MTKKTISKVIAMVCVAALCLTAVFTGVVSATNQTANYTVVGRGYDQGAKDSFVAADVTFSSAEPFVAGSFKVAASGLSLVDCTSSDSDAKCYLNVSNNKVLFAGFTESATDDINSFSTLTLTLLFTINSGKLEDQGTDWAVPVTLSDVDLTNEAEETYTCTASGTPVAIHVHNFVLSDTTNNVKTFTCSVCGATKTEVVAESSAGTNDLASSKATAARFTDDGDIELLALVADSACTGYTNVYFAYSYQTDDAVAHEIATAEAGLYNGYRVFVCKGNRGIGRMGRVVTGNFIGVDSQGNVTTSGAWEYSVKAYAESLFDNADADIAGYAKALWNYGKYTAEALNGYDYEQGFFSGDAQTVSPEWSTTAATAPTYNDGSDDSWKIKKAQVTTGYKPSMKLTFSNNAGSAAPTCDSIVIKVTHDFGGSIGEKIVYHKEVAITSMLSDGSFKYFSISDIPTKYLTDDITITAKTGDVESAKIGTYGFGRYTKSRINSGNTTQANVFKWMMTFAMYLGQEYA